MCQRLKRTKRLTNAHSGLQFTEILNIGVTIMYLLRLFTMFVCSPFSTETNPFGWKLVRWRFYQKQSALKSVKIHKNGIDFNGEDINGWTLSSINIASEASYVYILSGQKLVKNAKNHQFWRVFDNLMLSVKQCYQTGQF